MEPTDAREGEGVADDAPTMTLEQQVEYWMDRYFKLQDEHAALINAVNAARTALAEGDT
jgi:hypothetical protein